MNTTLNKHLFKTLSGLLIGSLAIFLSGCSCTPKSSSNELEKNHASIGKLQGTPMRGQMPTIKVNQELILSRSLNLPAGKNHIEVKYYVDSAKPIVKTLSFHAKSGYCYELEYANKDYRIKSLGKCSKCE